MALFLGIFLWLLIWGILWRTLRQMRQFLAATPVLESAEQLRQFKALAKFNMYGALSLIAFLLLSAILFFLANKLWLLFVLLIPLGWLGATIKQAEVQVQTLPVSNEALERERDRVVQVWLREPLPNWQ